jgi:hypothetical protein
MRDNKKELEYIKKKGFKVGDLVVVNFMPHYEFTITEIKNLETPDGDKMIFITVENDIYNHVKTLRGESINFAKKFDVTAYEIEHSKTQLRENKIKELGL